ncbi:hypothetical protein DF021_35335 [Burkholderia stagnalis]|uniref:Transposase n=1 Tax=Burkholderia stagnalis TaxID=1503054 RepID=A0ABX9YCL1_9BURK|nr:hypothetical protein DF158_34895 [Burkholderia stagnalis]RQQ58985.1 hypothetical protein DF137_34540 [Burkholderia stagnalis]RQQ59206.1 hypothetical protein DF139_34480 [Burkholderia stagnalis]RQQ72925.1 hypothetical protein DF138_34425 [Burkholderia stagnalis]RQQ78256.1 hypothetical protein DF134_36060 [Burkholderia stagnalis]
MHCHVCSCIGTGVHTTLRQSRLEIAIKNQIRIQRRSTVPRNHSILEALPPGIQMLIKVNFIHLR